MIQYNYTTTPVRAAADHIVATLRHHLQNGERVLWLLAGGSGIEAAVTVAQQLAGSDVSGLVVSLTDERYGKVGHADENWQQLLDAGFILPGAKLYRPLHGLDCDATTAAFETWLKAQLKDADYRIGVFGVGSDGHTAGIKPGSSATSAGKMITAYKSDDFMRLTITYQTIMRLDEAVIQAAGADKATIVQRLLRARPSLNDFPASFLQKIPRATLYTDNEIKETI